MEVAGKMGDYLKLKVLTGALVFHYRLIARHGNDLCHHCVFYWMLFRFCYMLKDSTFKNKIKLVNAEAH